MLCVFLCSFHNGYAEDDTQPKPNPHKQADDKGILTLAWENDRWAGSDQHYTNGFRASYLSPENDIPDWLSGTASQLPFFASHGRKRYSLAVGQNMYTPEDITQRALQVNDRPYAGWLYGNIGITSDTGYRLDNLELSIGIVGESAQAEPVQDKVHEWTNSKDPKGWHNQLKDEPVIMLTYERKWRNLVEFEPFGLGADITPHMGGSLGNVFTQAAVGATARLGFDLPADYGPPRIRPSLPGSDFYIPTQHLGGYIFAGIEGRAVAHNIFLDGNSWKDSHSVDKEHYIGSIQIGAVITYQTFRIGYTHVFSSKEFKTQSGSDQFGAITLSYRF
ncbi:MAG: lipid A deacylase LpxR family protein [Rickettsiales bacterium]|nr:lipid A deacylase LpxR family protein [Rickettsiales bacterium]